MKVFSLFSFVLAAALLPSCTKLEINNVNNSQDEAELLGLQDVAKMLSAVGIQEAQVEEVFDAATSSRSNGYDEEYTMQNIFSSPGTGVGASRLGTKGVQNNKKYELPLKDLITEYYTAADSLEALTKGGSFSAEEYIDYISSSDMQIYWPFIDNWDGTALPVITFDPSGSASSNVGYRLGEDGKVEEVIVNEEFAKTYPVWVVNNNEDAPYETLEIMRQKHPEWGEGGSVVVETKSASDPTTKSLVLDKITAKRNYDSFFAGGSEFFIKIGALDSFTASTEAEMYLYNPLVTDFMVKVKRSEVGKAKSVNTLLMSDWTDQLDNIALMIIEDDGGTQTSWKCSAVVKLKSKSYGIDIELPYHSRDDIVWRGNMSRGFIESNCGEITLSDVLLTFAFR